MKTAIILFIVLIMASCSQDNSREARFEGFYFVENCSRDTEFLKSPSFDTTHLKIITTRTFLADAENEFEGKVVKLTNEPAPIDGGGSLLLNSGFRNYLFKEYNMAMLSKTSFYQ